MVLASTSRLAGSAALITSSIASRSSYMPVSSSCMAHSRHTTGATSTAAGTSRRLAVDGLLLRELRARRDPHRLRQVHIAKLHPVRRKDRSKAIAVIVDGEDSPIARYDRDQRVGAAWRGEGSGKTASILLVYRQRERNGVKARFASLPGMVWVRTARNNGLAVALPGAAKIGHGVLCCNGRGGEADQCCERNGAN